MHLRTFINRKKLLFTAEWGESESEGMVNLETYQVGKEDWSSSTNRNVSLGRRVENMESVCYREN